MDYFVSAIGTDSGKSLVSALLTHLLTADYWKPVQAGTPTDADYVRRMGHGACQVFPSAHALEHAESPHSAAKKEGKSIALETLAAAYPHSEKGLIVEGAGGLLVPLTDDLTIADLVLHLNLPLFLVCNYYLGSINHSLLSLHFCQTRGLEVKGLIMNGKREDGTYDIIKKRSPYPILLEVPRFERCTKEALENFAEKHKTAFRASLE